MTPHPSDVELLRIAERRADGADAAILVHLVQCQRCAELVRYARVAAAALRRAVPETPPPAPDAVLTRVLHTLGTEPGGDEGEGKDR